MITLRPFQKKDAKEIVKWIHSKEEFRLWSADCFKTYPMYAEDLVEYYEQFKDADYYFPMVACDEDGVFGHFILRYLDSEHKKLRIGFIIVDDMCRGMGYGKAMLREVLFYAFDTLKVDEVSLGVFEQNQAAYHCYLSVGFEQNEERGIEEYPIDGQIWKCIELVCVEE